MSRDHDSKRHRTFPEAGIQILRRQDDQTGELSTGVYGCKSSDVTVKRASLAQEVKKGNVAFPTSQKNPDSISNMEKGTTFAARARAAELNSARAAAAAKDAITSGEDEGPELAPVSLGSLKFTLSKRRGSGKASRSRGQSVNLTDIPTTTSASTNLNLSNPDRIPTSTSAIGNLTPQLHKSNNVPPASSIGSRPSQSVTLGGPSSVLNQQAIRQKVREVSAKQQSINDNNEHQDEVCHQSVHGDTSVSPYSSHGSRSSQIHGVKRAELNTQHIRELRREAEKQREVAQSRSQISHLLIHRSDSDDAQSLLRSYTVSSSNHSIEHKAAVRQSSDTRNLHSKHEGFVSATGVKNLSTVLFNPPASLEGDKSTFPSSKIVLISNDQAQLRNPQPFSPSQHLPIKLSEWGNDMSSNVNLPNKPDHSATGYAQPRSDYDFSGRASFRLARDSASTEHQHLNVQMANTQAMNSATRLRNAKDSEYESSHIQDTECFSVETQALSLNSGSRSNVPPESIQLQSPSQMSGMEKQSPYGQQSMSRYGQHSHSVHTHQTQTQSHFDQPRPKAMEKFIDINPSLWPKSVDSSESQAHEDPFLDTVQSSSTVTPAIHTYPTTAQLRATSPAFVPSSMNAGLVPSSNDPKFVRSTQVKAPLPAVKITDRPQRSRRRSHRPDTPLTSWDQDKGPFNTPTTSKAKIESSQEGFRNEHTEALRKLNEDVANCRNQAHGSASVTAKTPSLRDPMPYTGFSSNISKKDQLIGSLNKTIDEAKAKGDLSASNRSVLFDPVASATAAGTSFGSSSTARTSYNLTSSNLRDPRLKPEAPAFDFPIFSESMRGTPEYDRNILKDSEPLPPHIRQQDIGTKSLSSSEEGFGYRGHRHGYSGTAPRYPPGLSQSSNPFQDVEINNHDGFWDDSLAVNSGNSLIEKQIEELETGPLTWPKRETSTLDPKKNAWFEEQKCLLRPKLPWTTEQLDNAAKEWFASGKGTMQDHVKNILQRSEGLAPLPSSIRYWEKPRSYEQSDLQQSEHSRATSGSRQAPIGSERMPARTASQPYNGTGSSTRNTSSPFASTNLAISPLSDEEIRRRAAIDVMAPVLANLASYRAGEDPGPCQRYSQPPAWCIDHSETGRKSFMNDNWGDVPKRVGRDPRYQLTMHEGRTTYFEDPNSTVRRDSLPVYKATPGWGTGLN